MDIQVQSFLNSATKLTVSVTSATTVNQLKTLVYNAEGVTTTIMAFYYNSVELASTATLGSINVSTSTYIGSSNTIATLATKEAKQVAKLNLAQLRRQSGGTTTTNYYRLYNIYDRDLLADKYIGNTATNVANTLTEHRPWLTSIVSSVVTDSLQLYLEPNEYSGSGTSWTDSSANAYTVSLVGAPAYNTNYFTFDGSTEYFDTNQSLAAESFSIGCWFRTSSAGIKMLISKETAAGNPWNYRIWLNGGQIVADMSQVTTQSSLNSPLTNYNNGSWYYVMFTRNDSTWNLYVNGTEVNNKADTYTGSVTNAQEVWFGRSAFTAGYQFIGDIGECFVYDKVLTASEVLQNYNATKATYGL